jgi:hypothetical protein
MNIKIIIDTRCHSRCLLNMRCMWPPCNLITRATGCIPLLSSRNVLFFYRLDELDSLIYTQSKLIYSKCLILNRVSKIPWKDDWPYRRTATYTGQLRQRINADGQPCLEHDSDTTPQLFSRQWISCLRPLDHCDRLDFSCGELLRIICTSQLYLQMLMIYEQQL